MANVTNTTIIMNVLSDMAKRGVIITEEKHYRLAALTGSRRILDMLPIMVFVESSLDGSWLVLVTNIGKRQCRQRNLKYKLCVCMCAWTKY